MGRRRKAGYNGGVPARSWVSGRDDKLVKDLYEKVFRFRRSAKR